MVLTGVSTAADMVYADAAERPGYLAEDLRSLYAESSTLRVAPHPAWRVEIGSQDATVHHTGEDAGDALSVVRAVASAVWGSSLDGVRFAIVGGDEIAREALERWSLTSTGDPLA